ncbi:sugar ABC transporter substrate-binding protein [Burkholderia sp. SRS-W-2-2016]|nr:sugar ABC transporter substrate-binding protein [Burkholderia sp. SRS-W-2-2016]
MRMGSTASSTAGQNDQAALESMHISVTEINPELLRKLQSSAADDPLRLPASFFKTSGPYRLGVGDVLQITVWDHPELAASLGAPTQNAGNRPSDPIQGFVVDSNGDLDFPYAGKIHVAGLRVDEAQELLYSKLSHAFIKPQLTMRVASYRARQVYVDGDVRAPGAFPLNDLPMSLYEALGRAGGFNPSADQSRLVIVRNGVSYSLNLPRLLANGINPSTIILEGNDLLKVTSRDENVAYVMGEVNKPVGAVPPKNGRLTLSDALAQAGSISTTTSDPAQLYVVRGTDTSHPEVFHLDARSPVAMVLANQFDLEAKDVVYVDGNGLVRFSRVLSLLLPAINAGLTAAIVTK